MNIGGIGKSVQYLADNLKQRGNSVYICSPVGPDIIIGNKNIIKKAGVIGLILFWVELEHYLKKNYNDFDLIWLHQPLFISKMNFLRGIVTFHTSYSWHYSLSKNKQIKETKIRQIFLFIKDKLEKFSLKNGASSGMLFAAVTKEMAIFLKDILKDKNVEHIPNGFDYQKFSKNFDNNKLRNKYNIPGETTVFIWVGRFSKVKQPLLLIDLAKYLININFNDFRLLMVGDGPEYKKCADYIVKNRLKQNIILTGWVDHDKLSELYALSDVYIINSAYEGTPLTICEAMASGLPCIVSEIPSLRFVEDVNCGIAVDFSDRERVAQQILDYIRKDISEYGKNARKYAEENLNWSIIVNRYLIEFMKLR